MQHNFVHITKYNWRAAQPSSTLDIGNASYVIDLAELRYRVIHSPCKHACFEQVLTSFELTFQRLPSRSPARHQCQAECSSLRTIKELVT